MRSPLREYQRCVEEKHFLLPRPLTRSPDKTSCKPFTPDDFGKEVYNGFKISKVFVDELQDLAQ